MFAWNSLLNKAEFLVLLCFLHLPLRLAMKNRVIISVIGVLAVAGIAIAYSLYNKPHREAGNKAPDLQVQATGLYTMYTADEARADSLYLDKVLQVEGIVKEVLTSENGDKVLMLESAGPFGISCTMAGSKAGAVAAVKAGMPVKVKGICNGMLMDVVLVKCVLVDE
jgi:hypothetical protein